MANIIFLDNFDSFTYNLVYELKNLNHNIKIYNNKFDLKLLTNIILESKNNILVISPGPGSPENAGILMDLIENVKYKIPILGICLGHQAIAQSFGAKIIKANEIIHGKKSLINHDKQEMFKDINNPMSVARYHSLMATNLPNEFIANAKYGDIIMAIRHKFLPICAFQFHPESILSPEGKKLLKNSLKWLINFKKNNNEQYHT